MNELQKDKIKILVSDEYILSSLRMLFEEVIDKNKPEVPENVTDQVLGQEYRAYDSAHKLLKKFFEELEQLKVEKNSEDIHNRGR